MLLLLLLALGTALLFRRAGMPGPVSAPHEPTVAQPATAAGERREPDSRPRTAGTPEQAEGKPHEEEASSAAVGYAVSGHRDTDAGIDCGNPANEAAAAICEQRANQLFRDYSRTVKEFRDRLGPAEAKLYGAAEFAAEGYQLSQCQFEASLAFGPADDHRRAANSRCVLDAYAARTAEIAALAAQLSDYSAVPKESSPEDAVNLRDSEAELESVRRLLWRNLDPGQTEAFEAVQSAWVNFRKAECASRAAMFAAQYGSSGGAQEACMAQMASERAARIRALMPP